jgi:hypothetical protein
MALASRTPWIPSACWAPQTLSIRLGVGVDVLALVELAGEQPPYGVGVHRVADLLLGLGQPADGHLLGPSTMTAPPSQRISSRSVPTKSSCRC